MLKKKLHIRPSTFQSHLSGEIKERRTRKWEKKVLWVRRGTHGAGVGLSKKSLIAGRECNLNRLILVRVSANLTNHYFKYMKPIIEILVLTVVTAINGYLAFRNLERFETLTKKEKIILSMNAVVAILSAFAIFFLMIIYA